MAITISVSNIKGGVCKTTTASAIAAGLNRRGYSVLLIDADPQTNLTMCYMPEPDDGDPTLYTLYADCVAIKNVIVPLKVSLDIIPGDFALAGADMEFLGKVGSLRMLSKALRDVADNYDYVIIDTPPNLGFLSINAFMASDFIVTPISTDSFSLKAIRLLHQTLDDVSEEAGRNIPVIGVLVTKYAARTNIAKVLEDRIVKASSLLDATIFDTRIRQSVVVPESQIAKMDLYEYAPKANVTKDYDEFVSELVERIKKWDQAQ